MRALLRLFLAVLAACAGGVSLAAGAKGSEGLRFNPFERPAALTLEARGGGVGASTSSDVWEAVLVATLVAGEDSLVNLGGIILGVGEEAHGYRLEEVRAWEAIFRKDGQRLILPVEGRKGP